MKLSQKFKKGKECNEVYLDGTRRTYKFKTNTETHLTQVIQMEEGKKNDTKRVENIEIFIIMWNIKDIQYT